MKKLKAIIFNKWTLSILTALVIAFVVYFIGPLIAIADWAPLASTTARWLTIAAILFVWQSIKLIKFIKSKNEESGFLEHLFVKKTTADEDLSKNERETLELKFKKAFSNLKKASKNHSHKFNLYEIPWYIIIGPPGSGKTTALLNSGLKFPLSKEFGDGAIQGIGGTRNCDWWFTDQGIIIDTAGRYTTQDSHKEIDSSAWQDFLKLLKKFRKRRPINGVFVSISLQELLLQTADQRAKHVAAISNRLQELKDVFKVQFPVYVLLTKSDLVSGFEEYFDNFGQTERDQVWGMTFPYEKDQNSETALNMFSAEYDKLLQTLNERMIPRLHQERDQQRAQKIGSFPKQLQSIKPILAQFLGDIFENSRYSQQLMLRGCYFCSGTQEGTPIDRLMNKLVGPSSIQTAPKRGKSFFIKNLFENIVFKESNLVGSDIKLEKRLKIFNGISISAVAMASIIILGGWGISYTNNLELIDQTSLKIAEVDKLIQELPASELRPSKLLPILNTARALSETLSETPFLSSLGLFQGDKLSDSTTAMYQEALKKVLLSRLMVHTENEMETTLSDRSYTYASLRTYLMLGSEEHFRAAEVSTFYQFSWLQKAAKNLSQSEYKDLELHINTLFQNRPVPLPIVMDIDLIERTRLTLTNAPLQETIYSRLQQIDLKGIYPFTIYEKAGQQLASSVFVRKSGKSLSEGIEALYTKSAYTQVLNKEIPALTNEVIMESWVYGKHYQNNRAIDEESLINGVAGLYKKDYIAKYKNLLNDIDIAPFSNYDTAANALHILSGQSNPSPLLQLLSSVKDETDFSNTALLGGIASNSKFKQAKDKLKIMLGSSPDISSENLSRSTNPITQEFLPLHRMVTPKSEGGAIPLNAVLAQFTDLNDFMNKVSSSSRDGALPPHMVLTGEEKVQKIRQIAKTQPAIFLSSYINSVANRAGNLAFGGVMIHINQQWAQEPYEMCINAVNNNYPFNKNADTEIAHADFGEIFGYGGLLESFFNEHLKEYVNTARSPWRVHTSHKKLISISSTALAAFEKAHYIRKSFFEKGHKKISSTFKLKPQELDDGLRGFYLELDGQSISYEFGPLLSDSFTWPGPNPGSGARMTLKQVNGSDIIISEEGDWAWFKLLDKVQVKRLSNRSLYNINFKASGYSAYYTLTAGSASNPYRLGSRIQFKCPKAI